jgi:ribonuclease HII
VIERNLRTDYGPLPAGMDEVGRGPLAGPVVACAVVMPAELRAIAGVDDSKQLDAATRERLAIRIRQVALAIGVGAASAREVDRINIYHATVLAMRRSLTRVTLRLGTEPHHVVVDGLAIRTLGTPHTAVVRGDAKCYAIACASIIAKVTRDRLMRSLHARYVGYGWVTNAGYGTPEHRAGIVTRGLTPHHRRTFCVKSQTELSLDDLALNDLVLRGMALDDAALNDLSLDDSAQNDVALDEDTLD